MKVIENTLLVIPGIFPSSKHDIKGIFIVDYIKAVLPFYKVKVLVFVKGESSKLETSSVSGYDLITVTIPNKSKGVLGKVNYYFGIMRWVLAQKKGDLGSINVIHAHAGAIFGNIAKRFSSLYNVPFVITEHTNPFSKISSNFLLYHLCKNAMNAASLVLPVSKFQQNQIEATGIDKARFQVIHNPVDVELFVPKTEMRPFRHILFVGRLVDYKGGLITLQAFEKANLTDWKLTIVGDGPEYKAIEAYINQRPLLKKQVSLIGLKTKPEFANLLLQTDFFVFPSMRETFGLVVAEAMSAGLPVITANTTAFPEFVDHESGILVNPTSVPEIAEAITEMANNMSRYNSETIRNKVVQRFGFQHFGEKLHEIYQSI